MPQYYGMPKLSDTMTEGTVANWLVKEGEEVTAGTEIAEIETDKATMATEAFHDGTIHKIYVKAGDKAALGAALCMLLEPGEEPPADADTPPANANEAAPKASEEEAPEKDVSAKPAPSKSAETTESATTSDGSRVKASPLAKRIADEKGVNLSGLQGTGPGGRIVKQDVLDAAASGGGGGGGASAGAAAPAANAILPTVGENDEVVPLSGMRRVIAERLLTSKTTIPHFYLNIELDAAALMALRKQINAANEGKEGANKYTINDFIMRAAIMAVGAAPELNASFNGDSIVQFADVNLSVAVAVEGGLVTPVIRNADQKSLLELSLEMKALATKARDKKLTPAEMTGGHFSISNLGSYGIDNFDAIINPPESAILSIGNIVKKPVVNDAGEIVPGLRMWVGMSCDHRVVDGAVGAQYLAEFRKLIEAPALMLV